MAELLTFQADLHIHTALSACAEMEMLPPLIVKAAEMAGLDLIGIADHNSCENAQAVVVAAQGSSVRVLPGLEVQSLEGVHLLCFFESVEDAEMLQDRVHDALPRLSKGSYGFREQLVLDSRGEYVRASEHMLSMPTTLDIDTVFHLAVGAGGLVIPSHIDRTSSGICGVLGFVPESPDFDALEVTPNISMARARRDLVGVGKKAIIRSSDAHWLAAIGEQRTRLLMATRSLEELRKALRGREGRRALDA